MYDCIIIGTGIAGVSAALTLKALKLSFALVGDKNLSFKVRSAEKIKNYPALPNVSGEEFSSALSRQLSLSEIEITEGKVNGVYPAGDAFSVMCGRKSLDGMSVILAIGTETKKPIVGEKEFLGKGVSYCAVCDGFLYRGKTIAVFAEGEEDLAEVELLARYAKTVYLFSPQSAEVKLANVQKAGSSITKILGEERVKSVQYGGEELAVDGVFMLKRSVAADNLCYGLKTEDGAVVVDRKCRTSVDGIFAAGDCTGRPYQYAKAAGEGNVCAYSVFDYLKSLKK